MTFSFLTPRRSTPRLVGRRQQVPAPLLRRRWLQAGSLTALLLVAPPLGAQGLPDTSLTRPLRLGQLLERVTGSHPLVEAARARVRAAQASRTTAGALGNPFVSYQVENARLPGRSAPPMDRELMTTATLPLEPLYQRPSRVRRANAEVDAAAADALGERQRVSLDAARAFYRTALAQVQYEVSRDLVAWLDTLVAYNAARAREGAAAEGDLIRSELERDRAAAEGTMHEATLARARADLATFLGDSLPGVGVTVAFDDAPLTFPAIIPPRSREDEPATVARAPGGPSTSDTTMRALLAHALIDRPSVRAARERLAASRAGISAERTMLFRQLGATVGTKQTAGTSSLIAGLNLPLPLFDRNRGEIRRAIAEQEVAAFDLRSTERMVRAEIVGSYEATRLLGARVTLLAGPGGFLARADEVRRIALGAYREGATPLFQVLDAARASGEARVTYYATLFAQHQAVLELLVALGRDPLPSLAPAGAALR